MTVVLNMDRTTSRHHRIQRKVWTANTSMFSPENLQKLINHMHIQQVAKGNCLYQEGDPAGKLYFILDGTVKVVQAGEDGRQIVMHLFSNGDLFGQLDPDGSSTVHMRAEAVEQSTIGSIAQQNLELLLAREGTLNFELMKWLSLMNRHTQSKLRDLMMYGKPAALCSLLIRLSNCCGVQTPSGIKIELKLTNTEMAEMVSSTREGINRTLADLKQKGVISVEDGHLIVNDLAYLQNVCHCEHCPKEVCRL